MDSADENFDEPIHLVTFFYVGPSNSYGRRLPGGDEDRPRAAGRRKSCKCSNIGSGFRRHWLHLHVPVLNVKVQRRTFLSFLMSCYNSMEEPVL